MSRRPLAALAALIAAVLIVVLVVDIGGPDKQAPPAAIPIKTITLGGPGPNKTVAPPAAAVAQADRTDVGDHEHSRSEIPDGVTHAELDAAQDQQERLAESDQLPVVSPLAAPEQDGCRSRFVRNYSSRRGVRPRLWVLHYTVSPNRPGWGDVEAIDSLFDRASFQASSNYVIDNEGNCDYIVRESDKAWTQATFNPVSISVEVINSGSETTYAAQAGLAKIARVISDSAARWDIPIQAGIVEGCTVIRSGIVDHSSLGACGGGHSDITPFDAGDVIAAVELYRQRNQITATDRTTCRKLNWWRTHGRPPGKPEQNAVRRRTALTARGVTCTAAGPIRR